MLLVRGWRTLYSEASLIDLGVAIWPLINIRDTTMHNHVIIFQIVAIWDMTTCSLVDKDQLFGGKC
jgi:cytochrome bd-type quinol oxidase subunit 2